MPLSSRSSQQSIDSLARYFLTVDANYKQFKSAGNLRAAAEERLRARQADYEVGRTSIDRYYRTVSERANAVCRKPSSRPATTPRLPPWKKPRGRSWERREDHRGGAAEGCRVRGRQAR